MSLPPLFKNPFKAPSRRAAVVFKTPSAAALQIVFPEISL